MSLLQNHTDALTGLRQADKQSLEAQFGAMPQTDGRVVGALYNSDTESRKGVLARVNPAGIVAGLKIAATLTGAKGAVLIVRGEIDPQELLADAGIVDLPLEVIEAPMVNKMLYKQDMLFHYDQLLSLSARFLGEKPSVLLAVD